MIFSKVFYLYRVRLIKLVRLDVIVWGWIVLILFYGVFGLWFNFCGLFDYIYLILDFIKRFKKGMGVNDSRYKLLSFLKNFIFRGFFMSSFMLDYYVIGFCYCFKLLCFCYNNFE